MMEIQTILIPFDFSKPCRAAAAYGFDLARKLDASIEILHVIPHSFVEYSPFDGGKYREEHIPPEEDLYRWLDQEIAAIAPKDWSPSWHRSVLTGDPAPCIVERAGEVPAPLVVMPTHGFGKVRRFILGSVAAKVLHDLEAPLLTGTHKEGAAGFGPLPYRTIACAVDLDEDSRVALAWAGEFASRWGASLHVIHVAPWIERAPPEAQGLTVKLQETLLAEARADCQELVRQAGRQAETTVLLGNAVELVPDAMDKMGADLLVLARGREANPVGRLWAHAYGLIRRSAVPVVSV